MLLARSAENGDALRVENLSTFLFAGAGSGGAVIILSKFGAVLLRILLARAWGEILVRRAAVGDSSCLVVKVGSDGDWVTLALCVAGSGESLRLKSHSSELDVSPPTVPSFPAALEKTGPEERLPKGPELKVESLLCCRFRFGKGLTSKFPRPLANAGRMVWGPL